MKIWKGLFLGFGVISLLLSAQPLLLMAQELYYGYRVNHDFMMEHIYVNSMELGKVEILGKGAPIPVWNISVQNNVSNGTESTEIHSMQEYRRVVGQSNVAAVMKYGRTYTWEGHTIQVEDQFRSGDFTESSREPSSLTITIDQQDWSVNSLVDIRPNFLDENRYHGYYGVLTIKEKGSEKLVICQRVSGIGVTRENALAWRILSLDKNGQVHEDRFTFGERMDLPQRVQMINLTTVTPISIGYRSDILLGWPTLFFPLLYPFVTALLGLLSIVVGVVMVFVSRRKKRFAGS